jgi:hypothetical protein
MKQVLVYYMLNEWRNLNDKIENYDVVINILQIVTLTDDNRNLNQLDTI